VAEVEANGGGSGGNCWRKWERLNAGESNG